MLLTALVQAKGGTLVVELPRDRIDLEIKIRSRVGHSICDLRILGFLMWRWMFILICSKRREISTILLKITNKYGTIYTILWLKGVCK